MKVTTRARYALRAITNLALAETEKPIPIRQIADEEAISPEFLEQIFFRMKKTGIITSVRGPGGGFKLNRPPEDISVKEIFNAVGERIELTPCTGGEGCERIDICTVVDFWQEASELIVNYFGTLTLRRIMDMNKSPMIESLMSGHDVTL